MCYHIFAVIACLFFSLRLAAQSPADSIRREIRAAFKTGDQNALGSHYAQLGYHFINEGRYDSSILYYKKSLTHTRPDNGPLRASSLNGIATSYGFLGRSDSAIYYYQEALAIYSAAGDTLHSAMVETNLSILFKNLAVYDKAIEHAFRAISSHEKLGQWQSLASSFNTISLVYLKTGDFQNALRYAHRSLDTRRQNNYVKGIGQSYNNIGEIYMVMRRYDSALANLKKAIEIKRSINDRKSYATTLANLGNVMYRLQRYREGKAYFDESLAYRKEFGDRIGEAASCNGLAKIALATNDPKTADRLLTEAEEILEETYSPETRRENLEIRIQACEMTQRYSLAIGYMRQLIAVKDSMLSAEKAESMNAWQIRYETFKKEQQIVLLEEQSVLKNAQLRTKQTMIYALSGGIFMLVVIAGLAYNNFRVARKGKVMQELFNKELNHRVKNNLQLLASVLSLQSQELTDENAVVAVKRNESRVNAMALIHRKLYAGENSRAIKMTGYINELIDFLLYSYDYSRNQIRVIVDGGDFDVDVDKAIPLGLIMNELVSNSLKYAFHSQPDPEIRIQMHAQQKELTLRVEDNGLGFVPSLVDGEDKSFGLKMINLLVKELRGTIQFDTAHGTSAYIIIPLK